jgi:putative sigma-54 modulation protein
MKITIQSPEFRPTNELTAFIMEKVQKFDSLGERVEECKVVLRLGRSDKRENKLVEMRVMIPGNDLFASRQCSSFEEAMLETIDALRHQLQRRKTIRTDLTPVKATDRIPT